MKYITLLVAVVVLSMGYTFQAILVDIGIEKLFRTDAYDFVGFIWPVVATIAVLIKKDLNHDR